MKRLTLSIAAAGLLAFANTGLAGEQYVDDTGFAVSGYDVVAYFDLPQSEASYSNLLGFIDPRYVAFAGVTYGVWMVLMTVLGGKGTIWGPVIGAAVFHLTQELFWTYLLGWQRVALGLLIVLIVVFFPKGIVGYVRDKFPERFGYKVDTAAADAATDPALSQAAGKSGGSR